MLRSILSLLVFSFFLVACGPIYRTEVSYSPPHGSMGKMCVSQCLQNKNTCEQLCQLRNENCRSRAHQDAFYEFEIYKRDQQDRKAPITKSISDFDRSSYCNQSCNCTETFNVCYSSCGGQVQEHKVCVAFCDKQL